MLSRLAIRTLRAKIIIWSFVPTAIILGAVALLNYAAYQRVTEDLVVQRNAELSRLSANQFTVELEKYSDMLTAESRVADLAARDVETRQAALTRARNRLAVFDGGTVLLDTRGIVTATYPERPELLGADWSDQPFFTEMLHFPAPIFSDVVPLGPAGQEVILVAVPVIGSAGEFNGALAGMFQVGADSVSALYGDIVKLRIEASCCAVIVDGYGKALYHSNLSRIGENFAAFPVVQAALNGSVGAVRTSEFDNLDSVVSFAPIPGTSWVIITQESWDALIAASATYRRTLLLLLALGVLVPGVVVYFGTRRLTAPIHALIRAAQEVADGHFSHVIRANTGDEIEVLAEQFNLMSTRLQESYALLEKRVKERTRELETLNAIAGIVSRSLKLDEVLSGALPKTLEALDVEAGGIYLIQEEGQPFTLVAGHGLPAETTAALETLAVDIAIDQAMVTAAQPIDITDLATLTEPQHQQLQQAGFRQGLVVALSSRGRVIGILFVLTRKQRLFLRQERDLLLSIARQIAVAIENARLFQAEQRRAEQFRFISEAGRQIIAILDTDDLLQAIVQLVHETFGYYLITIGLVEEGALVFRAGRRDGWPGAFCPAPLPLGGKGITAWAATHAETVLVPDVSIDDRYMFWPDAEETQAELAIPLTTKSGVIGVLNLESTRRDAFESSDVTVLESIARQAAIAIENAQLFEQAQQLAVIQERQRLARDLHDSVTQALYGVTLYAEATARQLSTNPPELPRAIEHLHDLQTTAREALREMRLLIFELRPSVLEEVGLAAALQARLESVETRSGLKVNYAVDRTPLHLPPRVESGLYRIAQEVLNNVLKHAAAQYIAVELRREGERVILDITDDGAGFDVEAVRDQGGLGLPGIRERAAEIDACLTIESSPGQGTRVRIEVSA
ncbi:MAG: hypothetical protein Kow0077_26860 [Anaerolineae bacterium]